MIDLNDIAMRLDSDESLMLKYKFPKKNVGEIVEYEECEGKLLDVAEESGRLYVSRGKDVVWVTLEEAIEVFSA